MKFHDRQRKRVARRLLSSAAVIGLGLVSATPQLAQSGRPTSPTTPQQSREQAGAQGSKTVTEDIKPIGTPQMRPPLGFPPATPTKPSRATLDDLKKNLDELQTLAARLQETIISGQTPNRPALSTQAAALHRLARCMQSTSGLRGVYADEPQPGHRKGDVGQLASAIGESIKKLMNNPVIRRSNIIDAELVAKAGLELQIIVSLSAELRKLAETREASAATTETTAMPTPVKTVSRKRPPNLQLTLDCNVWTADRFSRQPAKVKTDRAVKIEGVEIEVKHHSLLERQLIDLEDCMPCAFDEKAIAAGERYSALLKDFYSYESRGRAFAYHVLYEIVRTKDGKIVSHLVQPVSLHYVDEGGQGEFELVAEGRPLTRLPEWVKDLNPRR